MPTPGAWTDTAGPRGENAIQAGADLAAGDKCFQHLASRSSDAFTRGDGSRERVSARVISVIIVEAVRESAV